LIEEFLAVPHGPEQGPRRIDGLILLDGPTEIQKGKGLDITGRPVVVVQTKASRLGMYLLGQAVFSARIIQSLRPASLRSVAICTAGDAVLEPLAQEFGVEVVVYPPAPPGSTIF
jgi:hypothetical protein